MRFFGALAIAVLADPSDDNSRSGVQIGITPPKVEWADGDPSLQFQKDMKESMKSIAENLNSLSSQTGDNAVRSMGSAVANAIGTAGAVKDAADYEEKSDQFADDEAERTGENLAKSSTNSAKYSAISSLKLNNKSKQSRLAKGANQRRKNTFNFVNGVLNAGEDMEEMQDRDEDLEDDEDADLDESGLTHEIASVKEEAEKLEKNADAEEAKLDNRDRNKLQEANAKHIMNEEDCPPGYVAVSAATPEHIAAHAKLEQPEPCPVALADAPCPCIMESFEPLRLEKPFEGGDGEEQPEGTDDCEDFLKKVDNEFQGDMSKVTHESLKPLTANLKKGVKAGIRKTAG